MNEAPKAFKLPLISENGDSICSGGWSLIQRGDRYRGTIEPQDRLIQCVQAADQSGKMTADDAALFRSFIWGMVHLQKSQSPLMDVFDLALPLSPSAAYIWRIGMFDRAGHAVAGVAAVASSVALCIGVLPVAPLVVGQAVELTASFLMAVDTQYGAPGVAVSRTKFDAESLLHMLRLLRMRHLTSQANLETDAAAELSQNLDSQIFRLFVVNSRQISGLALAGEAEASSAVVAHSLIALTLSHLPDGSEILDQLELKTQHLDSKQHREEMMATIQGARKTISGQDVIEIERQLNRYLFSSSTAEAMDLAVQPVRLAFDLFGSVANGLGTVMGGGNAAGEGNLFKIVGKQLKNVSVAVDKSPDLASKALNSQFAVEAWTRKKLGGLWSVVSRSDGSD